jgi:hypothetical protein
MKTMAELTKELESILHALGVEATLSPLHQKIHVGNAYGEANIPICWVKERNMRLIRHALRRVMSPDRRELG